MDLGSAIAGLNWVAVLLAAACAFLIGALWYSKNLFGAAWLLEIGLTEKAYDRSHLAVISVATFTLQIVAAAALALFLGSGSGWAIGLQSGLLVGLCWVATAYGITYSYEQRSLRLFMINAGYYVVLFAAMGTIIGALS